MSNPGKISIVLAGLFLSAPACAGVLEGRIRSFECGDNCYLTVVDKAGKARTGLCAAKACGPWNDVTEIPRAMIGRPVRITTGIGTQYDGAGNVMGRTTAFKVIRFLDTAGKAHR